MRDAPGMADTFPKRFSKQYDKIYRIILFYCSQRKTETILQAHSILNLTIHSMVVIGVALNRQTFCITRPVSTRESTIVFATNYKNLMRALKVNTSYNAAFFPYPPGQTTGFKTLGFAMRLPNSSKKNSIRISLT